MKRPWIVLASMIILGACTGEAVPEGSTTDPTDGLAAPTADGAGGGTSGEVVNRQPPGQGAASVDGQTFAFDTPGGVACKVTDEEFTFSYIIGDNEVVFGGGASRSGGQWFGSLTLRLMADEGSTEYSAKLNDNPDGIAVDGDSVSYTGPMEKFAPAPPGQLPQPVDVGDGVLTATCG